MALDWYAMAIQAGFDTPMSLILYYYDKKGLTLVETAAKLGCSIGALQLAMRKFNIPVRPHGGARYKGRRYAN